MPRRTAKPRMGLRSQVILVFTALVILVSGGVAVAVVITVQSWIYSNGRAMAEMSFVNDSSRIANSPVECVCPNQMYRAQYPASDLTVIDARGEMVTRGTVTATDIPDDLRAQVAADDQVHNRKLGTHRMLYGQTIKVPLQSGRTETVQVYSARPLLGVKDKIQTLAIVTATSFVIGATLSVIIGAWSATTLIRPLRRLDDAARQAATGDTHVRLPTSGVAELAQVTETFNDMIERYNESVLRSQRFVADVSHELRTPLAALVPTSEILAEERDNMPPDAAEAATVIASEITNLARLVEDLMEISRHDALTVTLHAETFDLPALVRTACTTRGWHDRVEVSGPSQLAITADARRLEIAITNLIGNAFAHGAPPVKVTLAQNNSMATISIVDHGAGIPDEHLGRLFDRFYKVNAARTRSEGSGLGLSLAYENVRAHGGTISVASTPGRTAFTIEIPLTPPNSTPT